MQVFVFRHVLFLWYHTADLAHLSPRHPEMTHLMKIRINHHHKRICLLPSVLLFFFTILILTHLCEANASSRNQAEVCLLATPRAMPAFISALHS